MGNGGVDFRADSDADVVLQEGAGGSASGAAPPPHAEEGAGPAKRTRMERTALSVAAATRRGAAPLPSPTGSSPATLASAVNGGRDGPAMTLTPMLHSMGMVGGLQPSPLASRNTSAGVLAAAAAPAPAPPAAGLRRRTGVARGAELATSSAEPDAHAALLALAMAHKLPSLAPAPSLEQSVSTDAMLLAEAGLAPNAATALLPAPSIFGRATSSELGVSGAGPGSGLHVPGLPHFGPVMVSAWAGPVLSPPSGGCNGPASGLPHMDPLPPAPPLMRDASNSSGTFNIDAGRSH
jgi:hypothetical protein